jgi:hypothetical protein
MMPNEPRYRLLSVLFSGKYDLPSNFRVLATSRLENDIIVYVDKFINNDPLARIQKMNDIKGTDDDIYRFVVKEMSGGGGLGILEESQCWILATKAEGYFQWASTVCRALSGAGKGGLSVQTRFEEFMATAPGSLHKSLTPLDKLYLTILEECFNQDAMERYRDVMSLVLAVFEPLPRTVLRKLQIRGSQDGNVSRGGKAGDTIDAVICFLGPLFAGVDTWDTPVRPVHTSIQDFLLDEARSGKFAVNVSQGHTTLVWASLQLMIQELHFNMCELESSHVLNSEVKDLKARIAKGIPKELEYVTCFWDEHLCQIEANDSVLTLVKKFWYKSSLFWIEVLSVFQRLHVVSRAVENIRKFIGVGNQVCNHLLIMLNAPL